MNFGTGILGDITAGSLTIGNTSDSGLMTLAAYSTRAQPTSFITSGTGSILVSGAQAATGSGAFTFTGPTTLDANLTTASQNVTFNSAVTLGTNETINTVGGASAIDFASTVDSTGGARTLTLTSGTGGITVSSAMGVGSALGAFSRYVFGNDVVRRTLPNVATLPPPRTPAVRTSPSAQQSIPAVMSILKPIAT